MSAGERSVAISAPGPVPGDLLVRVQAEFLEMPGLRLTRAQARRLWALDDELCDAVLAALIETRFLTHSGHDAFMRAA